MKHSQAFVLAALGILATAAFGFEPKLAAWVHFLCTIAATAAAVTIWKSRRTMTIFGIFAFHVGSACATLGWLGDALMRPSTLGSALGFLTYMLAGVLLASPLTVGWLLGFFLAARTRSLLLAGALIASGVTIGEWFREHFVSDFVWTRSGYLYVDSPLAALLPWIGVDGLSWLVGAMTATFGVLIARVRGGEVDRAQGVRTAVLTLAAATIACIGAATLHFEREVGIANIRLIQTNVAWHEKFVSSAFRQHIAQLSSGMRQAPRLAVDLVVTPETAIPMPWYQVPGDLRDQLTASARATRAPVLLGILEFDEALGFVNKTALVSGPEAHAGHLARAFYAKQTLVPLGETEPLGFAWLSNLLALPASQRALAPSENAVFKLGALTIKPSICLDVTQPERLRVDEDFDLLVNQANLAWFPTTHVQSQFVTILRARARELRKSVVAVSNSGPSVAIAPNGSVIARSAGRGAEVLTVSVPATRGATFYARFGDVFLILSLSLTLLAAVIERLRFVRAVVGIASLACCALALPARSATEMPRAKDHPAITRFAGSVLVAATERPFVQATLEAGPVKFDAGARRVRADDSQDIEGRMFHYLYVAPRTTTGTEILKNYEAALTARGAKLLFVCSQKACGAGHHNVYDIKTAFAREVWGKVAFREANFHYLAARDAAGRAILILIGSFVAAKDPDSGSPAIYQIIVEPRSAATGKVELNAEALGEQIAASGKVAVYGLYFDTGSAQLKAESQSQLTEIARYLQLNPGANVLIVGHTDSVGSLDYNDGLALRRAQAIVSTLVAEHGIARARLTARGAGMIAPIASNRTEQGRAKNRRVEIVER